MALSDSIIGNKTALGFTLAAALVAVTSGSIFLSMRVAEPIITGAGVTRQLMLSTYNDTLTGSPGDTPVYEFKGDKAGGSLLVLGGTHPQEIGGMLAAVLLVENATVKQGRLVVVPQANRSGFSHTDPMEAYLHSFTVDTPAGQRWFRVGMRLSNPVDQWPDPDVFIHLPSHEGLVGHETRNLNRNHPGRPTGWLTARVSDGLTKLAKESTIAFDLHEAQPEYPVINMMVVHEKAYETGAIAQANLQARRIPMGLDKSPKNLHGLSHREFGDHAGVEALLAETANPAMGRFRGRLSEDLVIGGKDANYVRASQLGRTFVKFDDSGWSLNVRVARHLVAIEEVINAYNEVHPESPIIVENIPPYKDVIEKGIGAFLKPPPKS